MEKHNNNRPYCHGDRDSYNFLKYYNEWKDRQLIESTLERGYHLNDKIILN